MIEINIIHLPETDSTNAYLIGLLKNKRPKEGTVIVTENQTGGRGMDNNSWESEKDKNLTFSILLYPPITAGKQFVMNKAVALGICDFLKSELPLNSVKIKWPNDVYIGDKKACGILIQNSVTGTNFDYSVTGIGLNVNQTIFLGDAPNPVSMKMVSGIDYQLGNVLDKLLVSISERYEQVCKGLHGNIETDYQCALYRLREWHGFELKGIRIKACVKGTNEYGQLLLDTEEGGTCVCDVKEVKFVI